MERKDWSIVKMNWIPTNLARPAKSGYYIATIGYQEQAKSRVGILLYYTYLLE